MSLNRTKALILAAIASTGLAAAPALADTPILNATGVATSPAASAPITEAEVVAAQNAWGNALVLIATEYDRNGREAARRTAAGIIDSAYGYNMGPVLFKPTLASGAQTFRTTREGALSYFVGGDAAFPQDSGFALKGWRSFEVRNAAIYLNGTTAMSVGHVMMTDKDGKVTTVDKTWGYARGADGKLRIIAHHSSLPYSAN